jgi:hypothetical protein
MSCLSAPTWRTLSLTSRTTGASALSARPNRRSFHRRSLNSETIASLELADAAAAGLAASQPLQGLDRDAALARINDLQARFTKTAKQPPQRRTAAELQADLDSFSQLRSAFAAAPISSEELVAAVGRESHPPDLDSFTTGAQVTP